MAAKDNSEATWLPLLKLWHELGIAELPGQFAMLSGHPEGVKKTVYGTYDVEVDTGTSFTLRTDDELFIAIESDFYSRSPHHFLRYSTAKKPGNPPGFHINKVRKFQNKYDADQIAKFLTAVEQCETPPLPTSEELERVATNLAASPAEIGLIWLGGLNLDSYGNNFLPSELRKQLGWKVTDANAGRQSLKNLKDSVLRQLFQSIVSQGPAAPFAEDRTPVFAALEKTWQAKMPKRLPLEAALQKKLSAMGKTSRWGHVDHEEVLAAAAEPTKHALLQPREISLEIKKQRHFSSLSLVAKKKKEEPIEYDSLLALAQLVAMVHSETPAGHEARTHMPALIKQTTKLLDHPKLLVALHYVFLYGDSEKTPKPSQWLNQHLGEVKLGSKDQVARYDDELISAAGEDSGNRVVIGFRPAKLQDAQDMSRLRSFTELSTGEGYYDHSPRFLSIVTLLKSPGFQKLTDAVLAPDLPADQWPQNPMHTAPQMVEQIESKYKLSSEAALLYAQVLALPDPTTAKLKLWNGWSAAVLKKASAELVKQKLVLEAKRARAGRTIFLPGEWLELKTPWLPIEAWKLPHLVEFDLDAGDSVPLGGPIVIRPFEELFASAWQRVLDGDEPRYEEVQSKRKRKK